MNADDTISAEEELSQQDPEYDDFSDAIERHRRKISQEQIRKFENYAAEILSALGLDLDTPGTRDTPRRFVRALFDATKGYDGEPETPAGIPN